MHVCPASSWAAEAAFRARLAELGATLARTCLARREYAASRAVISEVLVAVIPDCLTGVKSSGAGMRWHRSGDEPSGVDRFLTG